MVHEKCSSLATSEVRAIIIQKRSLLYFCQVCKGAFKQIPTLVKNLNELMDMNRTLKEENIMLKQKLSEQNASDLGELNHFAIVQEIQERQSRASNIIIHNIKESGGKNKQERIREDTESTKNIIDNINNVVVKRTFRLGKYVVGKNRPIKVILNSPEEALSILKNKHKVDIPGIGIYNDQTKMQRNYYLSIKEKLKERLEKGETNLRIKYMNGIPTITRADQNSSQKN